MKYKSKPVIKEAIQFDGNLHSVNLMCNAWPEFEKSARWKQLPEFFSLIIQTLEGDHAANPGDYIIKGLHGEFYPCKPDIFEKSYEEVTSHPAEGEAVIAGLKKEIESLKHFRDVSQHWIARYNELAQASDAEIKRLKEKLGWKTIGAQVSPEPQHVEELIKERDQAKAQAADLVEALEELIEHAEENVVPVGSARWIYYRAVLAKFRSGK